jgi:thiamine pyrophosphate-dependent acetolactate synthase large subunit-like protein
VTLTDALARLVPHLRGGDVCIHANGYISRAGHAARDTERCFYMIGSMGLASSIGLGIALAEPAERVVVLDGDGNVLMNSGTLCTIAASAPANFRHVCFDNGAHASTGGQRTITDHIRLDELARAAGYRWVARVETPEALDTAVPGFLDEAGPAFLLVRIALGPAGAPGVRIPHTPVEMTARLRRALGHPG